jgi:hypothetical protein
MIGFLPEERGTVVVLRTGSATDIVESEVSDAGVHLEEERERLADTTSSTENGDLGKLYIAVSTLSSKIEAVLVTVKPKNDFVMASQRTGPVSVGEEEKNEAA